MKLTSLKRTKAERERTNKPMAVGPSGDDYGYGLCITLDKSALEKLGMSPSDFDVGDEVNVKAKGVIRSLRSTKGSSYDDSSVEIQLTKLGVEADEPESAEEAMAAGIEDAEEDEEY